MDPLTEHSLLHIFSFLPLSTLLPLRTVSTSWNRLILRHCASVHCLQLFGSPHDLHRHWTAIEQRNLDDTPQYKNFSAAHGSDMLLLSPSLPDHLPITLPALFPTLRSLLIRSSTSSHTFYSTQLPRLLRSSWSSTLTSLALFSFPPPEHLPTHFWPTISSLPCLTNFYLIHLYNARLPRKLPLLSRLHHLSLIHYRDPVGPILEQLSSACRSISLSWIYLDAHSWNALLVGKPGLAHSLESLSLEFISCKAPGARVANFQAILAIVCQRLPNLRSLNIMLADQLPLPILTSYLSKLPHLTDLVLYLCSDQLPPGGSYLYPSLSSVTQLHLEVFDLSLPQFFAYLPLIFPAITQLIVKCDYTGSRLSQFQERLKGAFKHLKSWKIQD